MDGRFRRSLGGEPRELSREEFKERGEVVIESVIESLRGNPQDGYADTIGERMRKHHDELFLFLQDERVESIKNRPKGALSWSAIERNTNGTRSGKGSRKSFDTDEHNRDCKTMR